MYFFSIQSYALHIRLNKVSEATRDCDLPFGIETYLPCLATGIEPVIHLPIRYSVSLSRRDLPLNTTAFHAAHSNFKIISPCSSPMDYFSFLLSVICSSTKYNLLPTFFHS